MKAEFLIETTIVDKEILDNSKFYTPKFTVEIGDVIYTVIYRNYLNNNPPKDFKFKHVVKKGEKIEQDNLLQIINMMLNKNSV